MPARLEGGTGDISVAAVELIKVLMEVMRIRDERLPDRRFPA